MQPTVYLVAERPGPDYPEEHDRASYLFADRNTLVAYFEPWFAEEHYLAIDSEGRRYRFVARDPGVEFVEIEQSEKWKDRFFEIVAKTLDESNDTYRQRLGLTKGQAVSPDDIRSIMADPMRLQVLAGPPRMFRNETMARWLDRLGRFWRRLRG